MPRRARPAPPGCPSCTAGACSPSPPAPPSKVERPPATSSRAPMRTYTASQADIASSRMRAGTSAPGVRHHRGQAHLAQKRALAAHVRAGEQGQRYASRLGRIRFDAFDAFDAFAGPPVRRAAQSHVVGHERAPRGVSEPTQGCLSLSARKKGDSPSKPVLSRTSGVQVSAHVAASSSAATASEESASSAAAASAAARHLGHSAQKATVSVRSTPAARAPRASSASSRALHADAPGPARRSARSPCACPRGTRFRGRATRGGREPPPGACPCWRTRTPRRRGRRPQPPRARAQPRVQRLVRGGEARVRGVHGSVGAWFGLDAPGGARRVPVEGALENSPSVASSDGIEVRADRRELRRRTRVFFGLFDSGSGVRVVRGAVRDAVHVQGAVAGRRDQRLKSAGDARRSRVAASKAFAASAAALTASSAARKPRRRSRAASSYSTSCTRVAPAPATLTSRATARSMSGALRMSARARPIASSPAPRRSATASWRALTAAALRSGRVTHWRSSCVRPRWRSGPACAAASPRRRRDVGVLQNLQAGKRGGVQVHEAAVRPARGVPRPGKLLDAAERHQVLVQHGVPQVPSHRAERAQRGRRDDVSRSTPPPTPPRREGGRRSSTHRSSRVRKTSRERVWKASKRPRASFREKYPPRRKSSSAPAACRRAPRRRRRAAAAHERRPARRLGRRRRTPSRARAGGATISTGRSAASVALAPVSAASSRHAPTVEPPGGAIRGARADPGSVGSSSSSSSPPSRSSDPVISTSATTYAASGLASVIAASTSVPRVSAPTFSRATTWRDP